MQCGDGRPANVIQFPKVPRPRPPVRYKLASDDDVPPDALTWSDSRARGRALNAWLAALTRHFARCSRAIAVGVHLRELAHPAKFYAFPRDEYLAWLTKSARHKVNETLKLLARDGAIIRAEIVDDNGRKRRRIFLNKHFAATVNKNGTPKRITRDGDTVTGTHKLNNKGPLFGGEGVGE